MSVTLSPWYEDRDVSAFTVTGEGRVDLSTEETDTRTAMVKALTQLEEQLGAIIEDGLWPAQHRRAMDVARCIDIARDLSRRCSDSELDWLRAELKRVMNFHHTQLETSVVWRIRITLDDIESLPSRYLDPVVRTIMDNINTRRRGH